MKIIRVKLGLLHSNQYRNNAKESSDPEQMREKLQSIVDDEYERLEVRTVFRWNMTVESLHSQPNYVNRSFIPTKGFLNEIRSTVYPAKDAFAFANSRIYPHDACRNTRMIENRKGSPLKSLQAEIAFILEDIRK
jgi:hypothetical protein